jgi:hypothetical protein
MMPKVRNKPESAENKPGPKVADEPQLINYGQETRELTEPVEIDIAQDADAGPKPAPAPRAQEGSLGEQARQAAEAEAQMRQRQQAAYQQQQAWQQQAALAEERRRREQADYEAVVAHISSAQSDYEAAQRDYIAARQANDFGAEADAQGHMARAQWRLDRLEEGRSDMEARQAQVQQPQPQYQPLTPADAINQMQDLSVDERDWLMRHQEYVTDVGRSQELRGAVAAASRLGVNRRTPEFFNFVEERLGLREPEDQPVENKPQSHAVRKVSAQAPVSRGGTDLRTGRQVESDNKIILSAQERQAALWSGISEHEYAQQKKVLMDLKKQGYYGDQG